MTIIYLTELNHGNDIKTTKQRRRKHNVNWGKWENGIQGGVVKSWIILCYYYVPLEEGITVVSPGIVTRPIKTNAH